MTVSNSTYLKDETPYDSKLISGTEWVKISLQPLLSNSEHILIVSYFEEKKGITVV